MREIPLTQGKVALVDDEDYEKLSKFKWCAQKAYSTALYTVFYAVRTEPRGFHRSQRGYVRYMHRLILNVPKNLHTDHIDGNGLNNQKSNLRIVTCRQNCHNRHSKKYSNLPGVSWHKGNSKWCAQIGVGGKSIHLGLFKTEEEAHERYQSQEHLIKNGLPLTPNFSKKTSKYCGVYWCKIRRKWVSMTHVKGISKYLGSFNSEEEAHRKFISFLEMKNCDGNKC